MKCLTVMYSYSLSMIVICLQSILYMLSTIDLINDYIIFLNLLLI